MFSMVSGRRPNRRWAVDFGFSAASPSGLYCCSHSVNAVTKTRVAAGVLVPGRKVLLNLVGHVRGHVEQFAGFFVNVALTDRAESLHKASPYFLANRGPRNLGSGGESVIVGAW